MTLAGTYGEDMAPDVEMRLRFPKKSPPPVNFNKVYRFPSHQNYFNDSMSHRENCTYNGYDNGNGHHAALLPPSNSNYNNPKRALSRNIIDGTIYIYSLSIRNWKFESKKLFSIVRRKSSELCE